jgi:hypothetical protein
MSDAKLRDLERRWKETGTVEDEAAYLLERVRVGDLSRERLELAAYCGHEAARRAVGPTAADAARHADTAEWYAGIRRWGTEPLARGAVAAVAWACTAYKSLRPDDPRCGLAIEAARRWCVRPDEAACTAALRASQEAVEAARDLHRVDDEPHQRAYLAAESAAHVARACFVIGPSHRQGECPKELVLAVAYAERRIGHLARAQSSPEVRRAITQAVTDWALAHQ